VNKSDLSSQKRIRKFDIIAFGLKLGWMSCLKGDIRKGLKRIILPVNYWRVSIFKHVAEHILGNISDTDSTLKILDIGSPKLLALYLSSQINGDVYTTDLQDPAIFSEWERYFHNTSDKTNLKVEYANAKNLPYPDSFFQVIYSLSVVHMISPAEDGDILALKEMQKKLCQGGMLVLEFPYRQQYRVNFKERNNFEETYAGVPVLSERQYDENALRERILGSIDGELVMKLILYERIPLDSIINRLPYSLSVLVSLFEPYVDCLNIGVAGNSEQRKKGKSVIMVFRVNKAS